MKELSLIERYQLHERTVAAPSAEIVDAGGKAKWEDTAEKREASLRERKAQMILAARQYVTIFSSVAQITQMVYLRRMIAQQQK